MDSSYSVNFVVFFHFYPPSFLVINFAYRYLLLIVSSQIRRPMSSIIYHATLIIFYKFYLPLTTIDYILIIAPFVGNDPLYPLTYPPRSTIPFYPLSSIIHPFDHNPASPRSFNQPIQPHSIPMCYNRTLLPFPFPYCSPFAHLPTLLCYFRTFISIVRLSHIPCYIRTCAICEHCVINEQC
jgi:hypothetical protein